MAETTSDDVAMTCGTCHRAIARIAVRRVKGRSPTTAAEPLVAYLCPLCGVVFSVAPEAGR